MHTLPPRVKSASWVLPGCARLSCCHYLVGPLGHPLMPCLVVPPCSLPNPSTKIPPQNYLPLWFFVLITGRRGRLSLCGTHSTGGGARSAEASSRTKKSSQTANKTFQTHQNTQQEPPNPVDSLAGNSRLDILMKILMVE